MRGLRSPREQYASYLVGFVLLLLLPTFLFLMGCPSPQQRWLAGMSADEEVITPADEDVRAGREQLTKLRELRIAAGLGRDYRIGPGDLIEVAVFDVEDLDRTLRVSGTGFITLPLIGSLKVEDLTELEAQAEIAKRLEERYVNDPQVDVFVHDYASQRVAVIGAVLRPGQYSLTKDKNTILDMISQSGGLGRDAGSKIYLLPGERTDQTRLALLDVSAPLGVADAELLDSVVGENADPIVIDVQDIFDAGTRAALTLPARNGDVIVVPQGGEFLVDGWVVKPGSYRLSRGITVLGAVTTAGGGLYPADTTKVQVARTKRGGVRMVLSVDIPAVFDGRAQDIPLEAGDIVYVPAAVSKLPVYAVYTFFTSVFRIAGTVPIL